MDLRQRVLECLQEYAGDDEPSLEQLVERLMVALVQKSQEIKRLEEASANERERLRRGHEALQTERRRLHSDPLYGAEGDYFFMSANTREGVQHRYRVRVFGGRIELIEQHAGFDFMTRAITPEDYHRR